MTTLRSPSAMLRQSPGSDRRLLGIPAHLWPALLVAYATLVPNEFTITIGSAALFPYRLALLVAAPFLIWRAIRAPIRWIWLDALVAFVAFWILLSMIVHEPLLRALEAGLALSLDFGLAYLVGRLSIRTTLDFRAMFIAFLPGLAAVATIQMIEALLHVHLVRPLAASLVGLPPPEMNQQVRLGLLRAAGPFPHPILGGAFFATLLPIAWYAMDSRWLRVVALFVAGSMIATVSTAAILAFLACLVMIGAHAGQRRTGWPLPWLIGIAAATFVGLVLAISESGLFSFAARRLSLSEASGQWRVLIWEFAGAEALRNPLFGIGFRDWQRPFWMFTDSIDAHFLLWSVRFGLPAGIGCLSVFLGCAWYLLLNSRMQTRQAKLVSLGISFSLLAMAFVGFTVALWEGIAAWSLMLCGIAVTIGTPPHRGFASAGRASESLQNFGIQRPA